MRRQHAARHAGGREAAHGVEQRADHPRMQEAGVLAHVFLAEVHAQLGLAVGGARDFEAGPAVEGGGLVDGLDGVEHGVQSLESDAGHSTNRPSHSSSRA